MPVILLSWSGILKNLDLAFYDLGFYLRSTEPIEERIILVEWDEKNLQYLEETTISDNTLSSLIEKIKAQQPRLIAFDIYRDIPVTSPNLTDQENSQAYNRLQNLFRSTPNLFGIEKVVPPKINPPKILKEKMQVGATDLPSDQDRMIRRAYIFPQLTNEGKPAGIPYLGVGLATKYLEKQGWDSRMFDDNSLEVFNQQNSIVMNPLKAFAGAYNDDKAGLDFLINWRKGKNIFKRVSTAEVISNQVPSDLFFDRLVIIGNVSSDTGDRHTLPLNRWQRTDRTGPYGAETFGVEIVAQTFSSIVSAALDKRPLMTPAPKIMEIILFLGSIGGIIKFIDKYRFSNKNLYVVVLPYAFSITGILILCTFIAHRLGSWLPIAWILASMWIAYIALIYYLEREREQNKIHALEGFNENLLHNLKNIPENISQGQDAICDHIKEIEYTLISEHLTDEEKIDIVERLETISDTVVEIEAQNNRIRKYRRTSEQFLRYCFLNVQESGKLFDVNQTAKQIVSNYFIVECENKNNLRLNLIEQYDPKINYFSQVNSNSKINLSPAALEIIIVNLLANAFLAVKAKGKTATNRYRPTIRIKTRLINNNIKFIIEDNGVGIPKPYLKKIFLPFKSYHNEKTGYGIGLYLAKKIVNIHRGILRVESVEGKGSKFIFTLPIIMYRNHTSTFNNFLSFFRQN
ncbi:MAG: CHASE2 domain-containing protein [Cyanobacteria bacterium J06600_6]